MTRLHIARGDRGEARAGAAIGPGERLVRFPERGEGARERADARGGAGEAARELVHLVFEADAVIVW